MESTPVIQTASNEQNPTPPQENYFKFIIIGIIILVLFISGGLFLGKTIYSPKSLTYNKNISPTNFQANIPTEIPLSTPTLDPTANWKLYSDKDCNYTFKYPINWNFVYSDKQLFLGPTSSEASKKTGYPLEVLILCDSLDSLQSDKDVIAKLASSISPTVKQIRELTLTEYFLPIGSRGSYLTLVQSPNKLLHIQLLDPSLKTIYDQITSTIQFLDLTSSFPQNSNISNISAPPVTKSDITSVEQNGISLTISPTNGQIVCNTDGDCQSGTKCMVVGPLIANQPIRKICVQEGQVVPN